MSIRTTYRLGFSLLETLMAGTVLAVVLVPALAVMKRGLEMARDVETVQMTTTLCVSKLEEHLGLVAHDFTAGSFSGNFAADGYANIRYTATRSDTALAGGIVDRLMFVTVTVWQDDNGNSVHNSGEISTSLSTKVAKMAIYQEATGGGMSRRATRNGMSLLELVIATAIMATIVTAAAALMRTSQTVWNNYNGDVAKLDAAHAVLRHIVRELRQCWSISAITAASNTSGSLSAVDGDGNTLVWTKSGGDVNYGQSAATNLLATGISELRFTGYAGDGVTATTTVGDIRSVQCTAVVQLDRAMSATKTIRCRAWLRAW